MHFTQIKKGSPKSFCKPHHAPHRGLGQLKKIQYASRKCQLIPNAIPALKDFIVLSGAFFRCDYAVAKPQIHRCTFCSFLNSVN